MTLVGLANIKTRQDYTLPHVDQTNEQMAVTHLKAFGFNSYRQPFATTKAHFVM